MSWCLIAHWVPSEVQKHRGFFPGEDRRIFGKIQLWDAWEEFPGVVDQRFRPTVFATQEEVKQLFDKVLAAPNWELEIMAPEDADAKMVAWVIAEKKKKER